MKDVLDVDPGAVITQITMIRCGYGSNIELFSYQSPDQQVVQPKNSDVGGYHIAFYVDDMREVDRYLRSKGVWTLFGSLFDGNKDMPMEMNPLRATKKSARTAPGSRRPQFLDYLVR